jgi:hypothetical protein
MEKYSSAEAAWEAQETKKRWKGEENTKTNRKEGKKTRFLPLKNVFMIPY